jgi:hypothetical protein
MGRAPPSPPRTVTAYPAAMLVAAFTSAWQAKPQAVQAKRAWLSRDSESTCPHAEHRWLVKCGLTFSTLPRALSSSRRTNRPHPDRRISRLSPDFWRTLLPGASTLPLAERVMFLIFKSSTQTMSNPRAILVDSFSTQSLRPSVSRARIRAMACFTLARRFEPQCRRASFRSRRRTRRRSRAVRLGACSSSPVDSAADTVTPRSMPTTWPLPGAGMGAGTTAKATCHRPARSRVIRYDFAPGGTLRDQRKRTQPTLGTQSSPVFRLSRRTCSGFTATTRNPSSRPAFRHDGRPAGFSGSKKAALARAKSRSACCCTIWDPCASHGCSARAAVSCLHCSR